jgi:hypothetical protein
MAKIKATLTGTINHTKAYDRVHHREQCLSMTRDDSTVHAQVNSRPLSSMIESGSVRTTERYDWKTGTMRKESLDVIDNAKRNINTLKVHPVTNARQYEEAKDGSLYPSDCCYGGNQTPAPRGRRK